MYACAYISDDRSLPSGRLFESSILKVPNSLKPFPSPLSAEQPLHLLQKKHFSFQGCERAARVVVTYLATPSPKNKHPQATLGGMR